MHKKMKLATVEKIRGEITEKAKELAGLRAEKEWPTLDDVRQQLKRLRDAQAKRFEAALSGFETGNHGWAIDQLKQAPAGLMAPERLSTFIDDVAQRLTDRGWNDPRPTAELDRLIEAAETDLEKLERNEEDMLQKLEDAQVIVHRRADARPEIVLGYDPKTKRYDRARLIGLEEVAESRNEARAHSQNRAEKCRSEIARLEAQLKHAQRDEYQARIAETEAALEIERADYEQHRKSGLGSAEEVGELSFVIRAREWANGIDRQHISSASREMRVEQFQRDQERADADPRKPSARQVSYGVA